MGSFTLQRQFLEVYIQVGITQFLYSYVTTAIFNSKLLVRENFKINDSGTRLLY